MCAHTPPASSVSPWPGEQPLTRGHTQPGGAGDEHAARGSADWPCSCVGPSHTVLPSPSAPQAPGSRTPRPRQHPRSLTAHAAECPAPGLLPSVRGALLWAFSSGLSFEASPSRSPALTPAGVLPLTLSPDTGHSPDNIITSVRTVQLMTEDEAELGLCVGRAPSLPFPASLPFQGVSSTAGDGA